MGMGRRCPRGAHRGVQGHGARAWGRAAPSPANPLSLWMSAPALIKAKPILFSEIKIKQTKKDIVLLSTFPECIPTSRPGTACGDVSGLRAEMKALGLCFAQGGECCSMLTWLFSSLCSLNCLEASAAAIRVGSDRGQLLTAVGWDGDGVGVGPHPDILGCGAGSWH